MDGAIAVHRITGNQYTAIFAESDGKRGHFELPPGDHIIITIPTENAEKAVFYHPKPGAPTNGN